MTTIIYGRFPEWPKGTDCKSVVYDFGGSNPPPSTKCKNVPKTVRSFCFSGRYCCKSFRILRIPSPLEVLAEPRKASKRRPKGGRRKNEKTPSATGRNRFPEGILHYIFRFATTRSPGAYFSHFPLIRRAAKQIARHIQSPTMAIQMPIAPIPK